MSRTSALQAVVSLLLASQLSACAASRNVLLVSEPGDAVVYVDGERLQPGQSLQSSAIGLPERHHVLLKRAGYETLEQSIQSELDMNLAMQRLGVGVLLGALMTGGYFAYPRIETEALFLAGLGTAVTGGVGAFLMSHRLKETYRFAMAKDPGAEATSASANGGEPAVAPESEKLVDIDRVPAARTQNPHAAAVIIGIETYHKIAPVRYAYRDATAFKRYAVKTLGIPEARVISLLNDDATNSGIRTALERRLPTLVKKGETDIVVYFAGHGSPDKDTGAPILVPYDGNPDYPDTTCYALAPAYQALHQMGAKSVTVVLDSCFSGVSARDEGKRPLMEDSRPLMVEPKPTAVPKNMTVFAAASGTQQSSALKKVNHGLYTYYFLKGLKGDADANHDKSLTVGELQQYLEAHVKQEALAMERQQTPVLHGDGKQRVLVRY